MMSVRDCRFVKTLTIYFYGPSQAEDIIFAIVVVANLSQQPHQICRKLPVGEAPHLITAGLPRKKVASENNFPVLRFAVRLTRRLMVQGDISVPFIVVNWNPFAKRRRFCHEI